MIINTDHIDVIYPELYAIFFTGEDDPLYIDELSMKNLIDKIENAWDENRKKSNLKTSTFLLHFY